jgi:hypothetical protein
MADAIERLYKVTVDGTAAVRELQKIAASTGAVDTKLQAFGDSIKKVGQQVAGAFAAKAFVEGILRTSEAFDQLGKDAQAVGVAVEDLQRLRYAADLSGVSAEKMDKAINALAVGMADLATGTSDTANALRLIGVTSADSPTAALGKIADQFANMPDGIAKTSTAITIFGKKVGPELIPLLNGGAAGLAKLGKEAQDLGLILSTSTIAQAEAFNDNLARLEKTAAAAHAQMTVGLLPALSGVAEALVGVVSQSSAFQTFGEGLGDVFVLLAKGAALFGEVLATAGTDLAAIAAIVMHPSQAKTIWEAWSADLDAIEAKTKKVLADIDAGVDKARANMAKPATPTDPAAGIKALKALQDAQAAQAAAQAAAAERTRRAAENEKADAEELRKAREALRNETVDDTRVQRLHNEAMATAAALAGKITDPTIEQANANRKVKESIDAQIKAQEDAQLEQQAMILLAQEGTEEQKKLAGAWLYHAQALKHMAPVVDAWAGTFEEAMKIGEAGFDRFVDSLSSGSVTAAQAFKGMAESIIADLLKMLAKRFILDLFGLGSGGGQTNTPTPVPPSQLPRAFARGGVISQPVTLPMALIGEAGPEAVMPLKRTARGDLGVDASGAGAGLNVAIHNHTDAAVSARRNSAGDLEVIIEQTRKAIAADFRRGGTDVARAAEAAYRLSRGAAAPF